MILCATFLLLAVRAYAQAVAGREGSWEIFIPVLVRRNASVKGFGKPPEDRSASRPRRPPCLSPPLALAFAIAGRSRLLYLRVLAGHRAAEVSLLGCTYEIGAAGK